MVFTKRKRERDALKESEAKHRLLFESMMDAFVYVDMNGYILEANHAYQLMLGYSEEELRQLTFIDLTPEKWHAFEQSILEKQVLAQGNSEVYEKEYRRKDGAIFPVELRTFLIRDNTGSPTGMWAIVRDITARKKFKDSLEKQIAALTKPLDGISGISFKDLFIVDEIQRLQDMFANACGVAALITHPDGTPITQASNFTFLCSEIIRKNPRGIINCQISDAIIGRHNAYGPNIQFCLSAGLYNAGASITVGGHHVANWLIGQVRNEAQTEEQIMEYARELGEDKTRFLEAFRKVPVMSTERFEQIAHFLFILANQISTTAYQNIQQARFISDYNRTEEKLRIAAEQYDFITNTSMDGFVVVDSKGHILDMNEAFSRMIGYSQDELLKMFIRDIDVKLTPEEMRKLVKAASTGPQLFETRNRCKDGHTIDVEISMTSPLRQMDRSFLFVRDITKRKQTEQERHKFEAQMREFQKLESLGVLAGGIAHDFNNLLMAILGNADLALLSLSPASPARQNIEGIIKTSQRAADLCNQMLAYSGKGRFVLGQYDLSEIVREMTHMLQVSVSKKAYLRYRLAKDLPAVEADATQLRQVIMNLITNASEALSDENGAIDITSGVMECDRSYLSESYLDDNLPEGRYVFLEVADSGCGMSPETREKIFDPFFSTKFMGRGLGLSAVLGIIRGHKGAIKVYSEPGKGTTIKILFPATGAIPSNHEQSEIKSMPPPGGGTVLLVDDDESVLDIAAKMLERLTFNVITASDGKRGLEVFQEREAEIDCALLDLTMPRMDGEEVFREIRRIRNNIRVILSSGYNEQEVTQRFVGKGLTGFVQKPYTLAKLREVMKDAFDKAD